MLCRGRVMRFLVPATQQQLPKATSFITPFSLEWYPKPTTLFSNNPFQELVSSSSPAAVTTSGFAVRTARMSFSSDQGGQDGRFKLSESSTLLIKKGDITKWFVDGSSDAIVSIFFWVFSWFVCFDIMNWEAWVCFHGFHVDLCLISCYLCNCLFENLLNIYGCTEFSYEEFCLNRYQICWVFALGELIFGILRFAYWMTGNLLLRTKYLFYISN